jgi:hypothetical protein
VNAIRPGSTPSTRRQSCVLLGFFRLALVLSWAVLMLMKEPQVPVAGPAVMMTLTAFFPWLRAHGRASLGGGTAGVLAALSLLDVLRGHAEKLTAGTVTCAAAAVPAAVVHGFWTGPSTHPVPR